MDSSPGLSALLKTPEPNIFNIAIKEEPIEILDSPEDCTFNDVFKNYLDGKNVPSQSSALEKSERVTKNKTQTTPAKTSSCVSNAPITSSTSVPTEQAPITKKIIINGQAKTCMVVDIPELKQNIKKKVNVLVTTPSASKVSVPVISRINHNEDSPLVKCTRCLNSIFLDDFRQHIDNCLPRKPCPKSKIKEKKTKNDFEHSQEKEIQVEQMETVQVMYNPFTGEVVKKSRSDLSTPVSNGSSGVPKTIPSENTVKINREAKLKLPNTYQGFYGTYDETEMIQRNPKIQLKLNCYDCNFKSISIVEMKNHVKTTHSGGNSLVKNTPSAREPVKESQKSTCQQVSVTASKDVCSSVATPSSDRQQDKPQSKSKDRLANLQSSEKDDDSVKSLASSTSSDRLPAFRGFDRSASQSYITTKLSNLEDIVRSKFQSLLESPYTEPPTTNAIETIGVDKTTTDGSKGDNYQSEKPVDETAREKEAENTPTENLVVSPRRTRSKSACGRRIRDKDMDEEMDEAPRRSMRLRSKSVCARKAESDGSEWSPIRTRSRSVCSSRFVSEKGGRDFKRAQSMPKGAETSETTSGRGRARGRDKKGNISKQSQDLENAEKKANFRSRSKSVVVTKNDTTMHPITYYQTLLKTRSKSVDRSKFLSDLDSLKNNDNLDNRKTNKVSSMLGISKAKSVSDFSHLNDFNDSMEVESENSYDDLLLLADSTFSCTVCSYTTDKQRVLKDHERYHRKTNMPIFRCVYCNQRYTKYMLYSHVQNVHPGQKFQICEKEPNGVLPGVPPQPSKINEETKKSRANTPSLKAAVVHPGQKSQICEKEPNGVLPEVLPQPSKNNEKTKKSKANTPSLKPAVDNEKIMPLNCSRCSFSTTQLGKMTQHFNKHNSEDIARGYEALKCTLCSFQTSTQQELMLHLRNHDFEPIVGTPGLSKFSCQYCSFSVDELQKLHAHCNTHKDNMAMNQCPNCDFRSTRFALRGHLSRCDKSPIKRPESRCVKDQYVVNSGNGNIPKYECRTCSYKTANVSKIQKHVALHERNEEILDCTGCDFRSTIRALTYHLSVCKGIEPKTNEEETPVEEIGLKNSFVSKYKCSLCSYQAKQVRDLNTHLKSHQRVAPMVKCDSCEFRSTKRALTAHRFKCSNTKRSKDNNDDREKQKGPVTLKVKPKSIFRCVHCKYFTTLRIKLNLHVKKHHMNRKEIGKMTVKAHACSRCSFTTNSQKKLMWHSIKCGNNFKCSQCSFSTAYESYLTKHMNSHKKNLPVKKCPCCDFASVPRVLARHQRKCDHTHRKKSGKNNKLLKKDHSLMRHSAGRGADFKCSLCSYTSAYEYRISMHMNSHKKNMPVNKCPCCDFASVSRILAKHQLKYDHTINKSDMVNKQHIRRKTITKNDDSSVVNFCSRCSFTTNSQEKLMLHSAECDANFKCTLCSFSSPYEFYVRQHMASHKNNLPIVKCLHCDFSSTPGILQKHVQKLHTSGLENMKIKEHKPLFQCSLCSFSTPLRIKLKIHTKKNHQSSSHYFTLLDKNYQCNHCSYSSPIKGRMLRHVETHKKLNSTVKKCNKCDYRSNQNALREHARQSHGKENGRVQSKKGDVKNRDKTSQSEVLVVPSRIRFTCPHCSYSSAFKSYLKKHEKIHRLSSSVMEQCANCTFRSIPKVVKTHFYSCTGRENPDPLETDPPTLQRANLLISERPSLAVETSPPILERMPPVLERADLVLNKEKSVDLGTATSSLDSSPPVLERATLSTMENGVSTVERTDSMFQKASKDPEAIPALRKRRLNSEKSTASANVTNFKCQYCSFESVLAYLLERHMFFHTVLKLPISQCDHCDFRSTPATLSAHQRTCSQNLREKSTNSRRGVSNLEKNQTKNSSIASRRKSVSSVVRQEDQSEWIQCNLEDGFSANKRKMKKTDDIRDNSLGRTPRKSRRLEEKFYSNNSIREMFVDVVSCMPSEQSRSSIRTKDQSADFPANKGNEDHSTDSAANKGNEDHSTDSTANKGNEDHSTDFTANKGSEHHSTDSAANKGNEDHNTDSSKILLLEKDYSEEKDPKTISTQNMSGLSENIESNVIRKKAFCCTKCNYSSSLRVKLRFHLKRSH